MFICVDRTGLISSPCHSCQYYDSAQGGNNFKQRESPPACSVSSDRYGKGVCGTTPGFPILSKGATQNTDMSTASAPKYTLEEHCWYGD